jgi:hypothetical protein
VSALSPAEGSLRRGLSGQEAGPAAARRRFRLGQLDEADLAGKEVDARGVDRAGQAMRLLGASDLESWISDAPASYADGRRSILDIRDVSPPNMSVRSKRWRPFKPLEGRVNIHER